MSSLRVWKRLYSTPPYNISMFKSGYPIQVFQDSIRPSSLDAHKDDTHIFDRLFLIPLRNYLANLTACHWINVRFKDEPDDPNYMPNEFLKGAKLAIRQFFTLLQNDIKAEEQEGVKLSNLLTKNLFKEFEYHHQKFREAGLVVDFRVHGIPHVQQSTIWMEFGSPERVCTTLQPGKIHTEIAPGVFWRYNNETKKWLFREVSFEYDVPPSEVDTSTDLDSPSWQLRSELTKKGAMVGVDVIASVDATVYIKDKEDPELSHAHTIRRDMLFRFETSHISGKYNGSWKIADIDNYFESKLLD